MRVVIVGATGNLGSSLTRRLASDPAVDEVLGLARRRPSLALPKVSWAEADVRTADLASQFRGFDAVVHLAWLIQPSRNQRLVREVNIRGSERVFAAVGEAGVPSLVYASSIGAYGPSPQGRRVDEQWPTTGVVTSFYARQKSRVERMLDAFEADRPEIRVVRMRPALMFKGEAATGVRRLFFGPLLPPWLARRELIPVFPVIGGLRFQCVHTEDAADAFRLAVLGDVRGAFNVAAEPDLSLADIARLLGARPLPVPVGLVRALAAVTWRVNLQPTPPGWVDMARSVPLMDTTRARTELGWAPRRGAEEAVSELVDGLRRSAGAATPPLSPATSGPGRIREWATGIGRGSA